MKLGVRVDSEGLVDDSPEGADEPSSLRDPSGRYQIGGEIGRGGMGVVYRGRDKDLGREVAMKVLKDQFASRPEVLARFVEEAQIGGQLQHPGIVPVYELGLQSGERPYFAMKLVKGETLAAQLARRDSPAEDRRRYLGIFEQICQTMAYAHARRVVHRDLKPENVMIGAFGEVQVVDWGFAKVLSKRAGDESDGEIPAAQRSVIETVRSRGDSASHSVMGSMFGTPAYMPPEQALGDVERVDERSDVFALGAILCEVLTGAPPYRGAEGNLVQQAARAELGGAHERVKSCGADEELIALSIECLSPAQAARPQSAAEVARRVTAYLTSVEERARQAQLRASEARLKQRVTLFSVAAGVVVLAIGAGVWAHLQGEAHARRTAAAQRVASALSTTSSARGKAQAAGLDATSWSAAVASAEQLVTLARSDDVDAAALDEAEALLAHVTAEANAARAEADRRARDRTMLAQLELVRIPADEDLRVNPIKERRRLDAAYRDAFSTYLGGASLFDESSETVLASMRTGDIEVELAASLDHWGLVRDSLQTELDPPAPGGTARLRELALLLDADDAWRTKLRALLPNAAHESARLRELAEQADFAALTAVSGRVLGQALWIAGEQEAALMTLQRGLELHPRDFDLCFQLAVNLELCDEGRRLEALEMYRVALAIRPEQIEVLHRQMLALKVLGRHADEERLARIAHARAPSDPHWINHIAMAQSSRGQFDEAIENYRKALELNPSQAMVHGDLGTALWMRGEADAAMASYRKAIELDPTYRMGHVNLGIGLAARGQIDEAIASHRRALELDPEMATAWAALGAANMAKQDLDEAIACFRHAVALDPKHTIAHVQLGFALARQGKLDEAMACQRRALELEPRNAQAHDQIGNLLTRRGMLEEAVESFRRALEIDPRSAATHSNLGNALREQGKLAEAIESNRRAVSIWQQRSDAHSVAACARANQRIEDIQRLIDHQLDLDAVARREREQKDGYELATSAYQAYSRGEFALAAQTYARALDSFPEQRSIHPNRYNAACSAVLASRGAQAGVEPLSDPERATWRERAREWLALDVERWRADLGGSEAQRQAAKDIIAHSQKDADLASVRDETELAKLPAAEAEAWRALWRAISELGAGIVDKR